LWIGCQRGVKGDGWHLGEIDLSERLSVIRCHRQHDPFCHTDATLARRSMRRLERCTALRPLGMPAATLVVPCRIKPWEGLRWPRRCQRLASVMWEGIVRPSVDTNE